MNELEAGGFADHIVSFLDHSPTAFHAVVNAANMLREAGYQELSEREPWHLERGGLYFLQRNRSSVVAFAIGTGDLAAEGFRLIGAHTDSPSFKIKPGGCLVTGDGYIKLNTEGYGGAILSTWFDRPLSIAGRVALRSASALCPQETLVDFRRPMAIIPNLCIHFNREINSGYAYNKQIDLLPLVGQTANWGEGKDWLVDELAAELGASPDEILDYELFLYESAPGQFIGANREYLSASRIDNLAMVFAGLTGLLESSTSACTRVLAAFDNEEVGSGTAPGADSGFLVQTLERLAVCLDVKKDGFFQALANSRAISADAAHAVHPNYPEKHDPTNRPILGGGPTIKYSASQRYATNALTAALFMQICEDAGVPCQQYVTRSDIAGGSTIGPAMSSSTSIPTIDMGAPILAMHSIRELACAQDLHYTAAAFREFYNHARNLP